MQEKVKNKQKETRNKIAKSIQKQAKGITLIALVITIIVLLILAAVSIATLTGENGILTRANDARVNTAIGEEKDAIGLAYNAVMTDTLGDGVEAGKLQEELRNNGYTNATAVDNGDGKIKVTFPDTGRSYLVDGNGNIIETETGTGENPTEGVQPGKIVATTEKNNYTDTDGNKATVPAGFVVSEIPEEQKVSNGLVIYDIPEDELESVDWTAKNDDGAYNVQTLYNQFVWIPVENDAEFRTYEGYSEKNLQSMLISCDEPFVTTDYKTEEKEYNNMRTSVLNYNGFYVGRYETGVEETRSSGILDDAVIKKGKNVYNNISWSSSDDMSVQTGGAVQLSKEFGQENGYSAISTLIYGVQWDAIMSWIEPRYRDSSKAEELLEEQNFVADSTGRGNYTGDLAKTGSSSEYKVKNIYDLAGNVFEWTMESCYTNGRVYRGGHYDISGYRYPASDRHVNYPSYSYAYVGFRLALYL